MYSVYRVPSYLLSLEYKVYWCKEFYLKTALKDKSKQKVNTNVGGTKPYYLKLLKCGNHLFLAITHGIDGGIIFLLLLSQFYRLKNGNIEILNQTSPLIMLLYSERRTWM